MTSEQKKDLEDMLNFYSQRAAYFMDEGKDFYTEIHKDRVRQIQEVLEVLGYKVNNKGKKLTNGILYPVYTITD